MSGTVIPLFSRRNFTNPASVVSESILVKAVDVSKYTQGVLIVRAHTWQSAGAGPTVDVIVRSTAPSVEDPSRDFVIPTAVATGTFTGLTLAVPVVMPALTANFGGMLQVSVKLTTGVGVTINTDLSAELVMRE